MKKIEIPIPLITIAVVLIVGSLLIFPNFKSSETGDKELKARFDSLSIARTNFCAGPDFIGSMDDTTRLQGSCCSPMDFHRYSEQVNGLKKYSDIDKIPIDPYDIPVSAAKELLGYQETIQLTSEQQSVYDEAMEMSEEGGPCCCKCWRWYAFEGLAKYLITEYDFNSEQIAEVWDLEDGCGGSGHTGHMADEIAEREIFEPQS